MERAGRSFFPFTLSGKELLRSTSGSFSYAAACRLIQTCLQKDPKERLRAIGDWRLLLNDTTPPVSDQPHGSRLAWAAATLFALIALTLAFGPFSSALRAATCA